MQIPQRVPQPIVSLVKLFSGKGAQAGYLAAFDQGVISLGNFIATIILARQVSPTELGVYGVGFTLLRLVRSVQEGITIQPVNTYGPGMDDGAFRRYASSTTLIQLMLALASSLAVAATGWLLTRLGNDTAGPALFSLWFPFLAWQLQEYIRRLMYTRGNVAGAVLNTVLSHGFRLGIMIVWSSRNQLSGAAGIYAIAWGSLLAILPGVWQIRKFLTAQFEDLRSTWRRNWVFGRWVLGGTIMSWVSVEFYPVLTAGMISFAAAGAYRALQNLVAPIHLILRATDTYLTPRAARQFEAGGWPALARVLRLSYIATGAPVVILLIIGIMFPVPMLKLLYGETYVAYSQGMAFMTMYYGLLFAYFPLQSLLKAARISQPIFIANLSAIAIMFTVGIWMILRWGVYGTIAGQALNALVVTVILWGAWFRYRQISLKLSA